jgi:hypothetical protein
MVCTFPEETVDEFYQRSEPKKPLNGAAFLVGHDVGK